jgi:hypothetical protein
MRFAALEFADEGPRLVIITDDAAGDRSPEDVLAELVEFALDQGQEPVERLSGRQLGRLLAELLPQKMHELADPDNPDDRFIMDVLRGFAECCASQVAEAAGVAAILNADVT